MKYLPRIFLYFLVIVVLIGLAIFIKNDYLLTAVYLGVIIASITLKKERMDLPILALGFSSTLVGESLFIGTGIETFNRTSLLGIMPLWLPFLWGYVFLAMKRVCWMLVKECL